MFKFAYNILLYHLYSSVTHTVYTAESETPSAVCPMYRFPLDPPNPTLDAYPKSSPSGGRASAQFWISYYLIVLEGSIACPLRSALIACIKGSNVQAAIPLQSAGCRSRVTIFHYILKTQATVPDYPFQIALGGAEQIWEHLSRWFV